MRRALLLFKNLILKNKKQIIFALFAFIGCVVEIREGVEIMAVPVVIAAGAAAGGGTAAVAGGTVAATTGTAAAGVSATTAGTVATTAGTAGAAVNGTTATAGAAVKTGATAAKTASSTSGSTTSAGANLGSGSSGLSKMPNTNFIKGNPFGNMSLLPNGDEESDSDKNNKDSSDDSNAELNDDYEVFSEEKSRTPKKNNSFSSAIGCVIVLPIFLLFFVPIALTFLITPTSSVVSKIDCSISTSELCEEKQEYGIFTSFFEKAKNFILYGSFDTNANVIAKESERIHEDISNQYSVSIDIPLLASTILVDGNEISDEVEQYDGENNKPNQIILDRIKYLYDLAYLQLKETAVAFTCRSKEVDGETVYYKETNYLADADSLPEAGCDASTVGMTLKEMIYELDIEGYYDRLLENKELLIQVYGKETLSDDKAFSLLIDEIKTLREIYNVMYENSDEGSKVGNVPASLIYDTNVNIQSPLKGDYYVTSPYGNRGGSFHKGMDLVSNDHNIYAAGDGVVTRANKETLGGYVLEITHTASDGTKYISQYGHLDRFLISKGDTVKAGDIVAIMGNTGVSTGTHLHFQMWEVGGDTYNPANLFSES